jgi:hypothetical protein
MSPRTASLRPALSLLALCFATLAASPGVAQTWVPTHPLGQQVPGKPAQVALNPLKSTPTYTTIDVTIYGFWKESVVGQDGATYDRLTFPGLDSIGQVGAPDLPAARVNVAVGDQAAKIKFDGVSSQTVVKVKNLLPLPTFVSGEDDLPDPTGDPGPGDTTGTSPKWAYDAAIYTDSAPWPSLVTANVTLTDNVLGPIHGGTVEFYPVTFVPADGAIDVASSMSLGFSMSGGGSLPQTVTKYRDEAAGVHFVNWNQVQIYYPYDFVQYHSRYLIVAQSMWWDTLAPFVAHKKSQGYEVSMIQLPADLTTIRSTIAGWYGLGDPGMDHYALLVGDTDFVPLVPITKSGVTVLSDDPYGCVGQINQSKEVHVGRISVDSADDLGAQLQKIIDYDLNPAPGNYGNALLVSHREGAPGKYTGSHIKVRDASYQVPPTFTTLFGESSASNQDVWDELNNNGIGVVAYRGHGSTSTWFAWNQLGENVHKSDLEIELTNSMLPVVWAITCTNSNIAYTTSDAQDCISEIWMEAANGGVAAYGATQTTSTTPNHRLNEELFRIVYDQGVTTHAKAIELAEQSVWSQWPDHKNPWSYLLLGDPSMTIRRGPVNALGFVAVPNSISLDLQSSALSLTGTSSGDSFEDGLVSIYKASFLGGQPDEALGAYWLDSNNDVKIPLSLTTPGTLFLSIRDSDGNMAQQQIPVPMGSAWKELGDGMSGIFGEPKLAGIGTLDGGTPWKLLLSGAEPLSTAFLCASPSTIDIPFLGGVLVPNILTAGFLLPVPTDKDGNATFGNMWPSGIAGGLKLYFQYWILDPDGPQGWAGSNAVRANTPF